MVRPRDQNVSEEIDEVRPSGYTHGRVTQNKNQVA